uniref:(northern house mosquito) hypothetical protein n=1 Tax=Culex pipiens TaxID=7175 RepID=A0A8D8F2V9_CULPI
MHRRRRGPAANQLRCRSAPDAEERFRDQLVPTGAGRPAGTGCQLDGQTQGAGPGRFVRVPRQRTGRHHEQWRFQPKHLLGRGGQRGRSARFGVRVTAGRGLTSAGLVRSAHHDDDRGQQ